MKKNTNTAARKSPKITIRENAWGNWYGYVSGRRVEAFFSDACATQEQNAREWLARCERAEASERPGFVADIYRGHRPGLK